MQYEEIYFKVADMEYNGDRGPNRPHLSQLLSYGQIGGRKFVILNVKGEYPLAYVEALPGDTKESPASRVTAPQIRHSSEKAQKKYFLLEHWSNIQYWTIRFDFVSDFVDDDYEPSYGKKYNEAEILRDYVKPLISVLNYLNPEC